MQISAKSCDWGVEWWPGCLRWYAVGECGNQGSDPTVHLWVLKVHLWVVKVLQESHRLHSATCLYCVSTPHALAYSVILF